MLETLVKIKNLTPRTKTGRVVCGSVPIGGGSPIAIQSMTNTFTEEAAETAAQAIALAQAGADIVRCAVPSPKAAVALKEVLARIQTSGTEVPIVADIHFDYRIALESIKSGVHKIRINPGNIGGKDRIKAVVDAAGAAGIPVRIGVNCGSLEEDLLPLYDSEPARALAESAVRNIEIIRGLGFEDLVVSIKASDVVENTEAHKLLSAVTDLPLHIGITEAGYGRAGVVKSAAGIGALLAMGIGDTIRVSLTGDPLKEIPAARDILRSVNLLPGQITMISCPTCGRCRMDLLKICKEVSSAMYETELLRMAEARRIRRGGPEQGEEAEAFALRLAAAERPIVVAVMGCRVNGPGEAAHADLGVACGEFGGVYFEKGVRGEVVPTDKITRALVDGVEALL